MELITGTSNINNFIAAIFFSIIGVVLFKLLQVSKRNITSERSPMFFSWKFFWKDNWVDLLLTILFIYVTVRFTQDIVTNYLGGIVNFDAFKDGMFIYLVCGIFNAKLITIFRNAISKNDQ